MISPFSSDPRTLLTPLGTNLEGAYAWHDGSWLSFDLEAPGFLNSLTAITPRQGLIIKVRDVAIPV